MQARVRAATVADARAIAEVHVEGWRWGYRDLLPDAVLAALDVDEREAWWATHLAEDAPLVHRCVAERDDGLVVGFAASGPASADQSPPPPSAGELFAVYLRDGSQGTGVGRALLSESRSALTARRFTDAVLWVFEANARARRFYEADGWRPDGTEGVYLFEGGERAVMRYATVL